MEALLTRYRNLTLLLLVILAQLVLLAYQVKTHQDVRLIRVWAVTLVTPVARVLEFVREHTIGVAENYFVLVNVRGENERLKRENGKLKIENQFLKAELQTADRARALAQFQQRTPSRTVPARIIGTGTGANSRSVFIDIGSAAGLKRGMAVITPDGIVGKVLASYPTASQVLLITDPNFAAGVISDKNRVHGTVKGTGQNKVIVDYVQNEEKLEVGETFYTSGDDRIFPKGMPVGKVTVVRPGKTFKDIFLNPSGFQQGLEEVLIVIEGVNGTIPDPQEQKALASPDIYLQPQPTSPGTPATDAAATATGNLNTEADRVRERYKRLGEQQGVKFGEGGKIPDFNARPQPAGTAGSSPGTTVTPGPTAGSKTGAGVPLNPPSGGTGVAGQGTPGSQSGSAPVTRPASPGAVSPAPQTGAPPRAIPSGTPPAPAQRPVRPAPAEQDSASPPRTP